MLLLAPTPADCQTMLELSFSFCLRLRLLRKIVVQTNVVRRTANKDATMAVDENVPMAENGPEPTADRTTGVA